MAKRRVNNLDFFHMRKELKLMDLIIDLRKREPNYKLGKALRNKEKIIREFWEIEKKYYKTLDKGKK